MSDAPVSTVPIAFVLTSLESETTLGQLATVYNQTAIEPIEANARAVLYVKEDDIKAVFHIKTDAADVMDTDSSDIEFHTYYSAFTDLAINPANAMMNVDGLSTNAIALADKNSVPYAADKCLVAHDFVRHLAKDLFGSHIGVDILNNEVALLQNIRTKCGDSEGNVMDVINGLVKKVSRDSEDAELDGLDGEDGAKYMTNENATPVNLCRELYNQMISGEPSRFANLGEASSDTDTRPLPFFPGDSINFKLIINPAEGQHEFVRGAEGTPVANRSYEIRLQVIANDSDLVNTPPATEEEEAAAP